MGESLRLVREGAGTRFGMCKARWAGHAVEMDRRIRAWILDLVEAITKPLPGMTESTEQCVCTNCVRLYGRRQAVETTHLSSCRPSCLDFWRHFCLGGDPLQRLKTRRCTPKIRLQPSFQGRSWKRWNGLHILVLDAHGRSLSVCSRACCWLLCSLACSAVNVCYVVRARRLALVARLPVPACSASPISGRNRRRPDSSQESMREH